MKVGDEFPRRVARFSKGLAQCTAEASTYANCVITKPNLKKNDCLKEFDLLRKCVQKSFDFKEALESSKSKIAKKTTETVKKPADRLVKNCCDKEVNVQISIVFGMG